MNGSSCDQDLVRKDTGDQDDVAHELNLRDRYLSPHGQDALQVGDELGRFRLDGILGRGGMGIVYRGTDKTDGKQVAVKVLQLHGSDIAHAIRRFTKEARNLSERAKRLRNRTL